MTGTQKPTKVFYRSIAKSYNLLINHSIECLNFNQLLITASGLLIGFAVVFGSAAPLFADYTLILKSGHTVNVAAYKEEGDVIIFTRFGGEVRIAKEDVKSIIPAVEGGGISRFPFHVLEAPGKAAEAGPGEKQVARPGKKQAVEDKKEKPLAIKEKVLTPEEIRTEERAKQEKEYQKRVKEVTVRLKALMNRYSLATRGKIGPEPSLLDSPEAIRARTADLNSRLKDAARTPARPSDRGAVRLKRRSTFTGAPPTIIKLKPRVTSQRVRAPLTPYSPKEKELSQLRRQMLALEKQRDRLIQEMRDRNFNTASLFLE